MIVLPFLHQALSEHVDLITDILLLEIVGQSCGQGNRPALSSIVEPLEFLESLLVETVEVPDDGASDHEYSQRDYGVPEWKGEYLRISASMAGECLWPILLP